MSATANVSGSVQVTANSATTNIAASTSYAMAGEDFVNQTQYVGTAYTAIDLGNLASTGQVLIKVLPGTGSQTLDVAVDVAGTKHHLSQIAENDFIKLVKPANPLYAKASSATLGFQVVITEQ